jgi:5'-deoxynucleotidase YfbR-like HD superfamily hydrolase
MGSNKLSVALSVAAVGIAIACLKFELISFELLASLLPVSLCLIALAVGALGFKSLFERAVFFLDKDQQLRVQGFTEVSVRNGPGITVLNPLGYRKAEKRTAHTLSAKDFIKVAIPLMVLRELNEAPNCSSSGSMIR